MFSVMLFIFFCFFGVLAMFFYICRRQEILVRGLREENTQTRVLIRALESRLDYLAQLCLSDKSGAADGSENGASAPGVDPLLHLSFDEPSPGPGQPPKNDMDINL